MQIRKNEKWVAMHAEFGRFSTNPDTLFMHRPVDALHTIVIFFLVLRDQFFM